MALLIILAALGIGLVVLLGRTRTNHHQTGDLTSDVDADELTAAEEELRDLDTRATPEDADDALPDWGPGVPKRQQDD